MNLHPTSLPIHGEEGEDDLASPKEKVERGGERGGVEVVKSAVEGAEKDNWKEGLQ